MRASLGFGVALIAALPPPQAPPVGPVGAAGALFDQGRPSGHPVMPARRSAQHQRLPVWRHPPHGAVLMVRAGWHSTGKLKVPKNLTIIPLPARAPELNPVENIWQYLRQNWLSNRVDHVHRIERLGAHRSIINAVGITVIIDR